MPPSAPPAQLGNLDIVIETAVNSLIALAGAAFVVMLVIAGYQYLNAGANKQQVEKAQHMLTYAFIGLVVVGSAWLLVNVFGQFLGITSSNWGNFTICIVGSC